MAKLSKDVLLAAVLAVHLEVGAVDGVEAFGVRTKKAFVHFAAC